MFGYLLPLSVLGERNKVSFYKFDHAREIAKKHHRSNTAMGFFSLGFIKSNRLVVGSV